MWKQWSDTRNKITQIYISKGLANEITDDIAPMTIIWTELLRTGVAFMLHNKIVSSQGF